MLTAVNFILFRKGFVESDVLVKETSSEDRRFLMNQERQSKDSPRRRRIQARGDLKSKDPNSPRHPEIIRVVSEVVLKEVFESKGDSDSKDDPY